VFCTHVLVQLCRDPEELVANVTPEVEFVVDIVVGFVLCDEPIFNDVFCIFRRIVVLLISRAGILCDVFRFFCRSGFLMSSDVLRTDFRLACFNR
jgi:hypothetical protein